MKPQLDNKFRDSPLTIIDFSCICLLSQFIFILCESFRNRQEILHHGPLTLVCSESPNVNHVKANQQTWKYTRRRIPRVEAILIVKKLLIPEIPSKCSRVDCLKTSPLRAGHNSNSIQSSTRELFNLQGKAFCY